MLCHWLGILFPKKNHLKGYPKCSWQCHFLQVVHVLVPQLIEDTSCFVVRFLERLVLPVAVPHVSAVQLRKRVLTGFETIFRPRARRFAAKVGAIFPNTNAATRPLWVTVADWAGQLPRPEAMPGSSKSMGLSPSQKAVVFYFKNNILSACIYIIYIYIHIIYIYIIISWRFPKLGVLTILIIHHPF